MSKFNLSDGSSTFHLDIHGQYFDDQDQLLGTWQTGDSNAVVLLSDSGDETVVPVHWRFNDDNQLCLLDEQGSDVHNFCLDVDQRMKCSLRDATLRVKPTRNHPFEFDIHGDWHLNDKHQLEFTSNGAKSVLDGILSDKKSRFIYRVKDKQNPRINYRLGFVGRWEQITQDDGTPRLRFHYRRGADAEGVFEMPHDGRLVIQNGMNQFRYVYDRDNRTFGVTLLGFLKVSETLEITYSIDKQSASNGDEMVAATTFALQAAFSGNQFDGDLGLVIVKDDNTPGNYEMTLTGDYLGVVGDTRVMVGFRFSQRRNGHLVTRKFGIGGAFELDNGVITYAFDVGHQTVKLEAGIDIRLKNGGDVTSKFALVGSDGQVRTITFLLGVTF